MAYSITGTQIRIGQTSAKGHEQVDIKKVLKSIIKPFVPVCFSLFPELKCVRRYMDVYGRVPNLIKPETFNEKLIRKLLFDRNPNLRLFTDKFLVRDFIKSKLGEQYLTKLYGVVDSPVKIRDLNLPNRFVMKPNHLCGQIKIVHDLKSLTAGELEKLAGTWLSQDHYEILNEWAYKNIQPRITFEESLDIDGNTPDDWKFFCFNGQPQFVEIHKDRFINHECNIYDLNLSLLPVNMRTKNVQEKIDPPHNFEEMLGIARKLSAGTDFIRVDLYNINGRIVFGELTNYPGAGLDKFEPAVWDTKFGSYWN